MNQYIENLDKKCEAMSFEELKESINSWLDSLVKNNDLLLQSAKGRETFEALIKILEGKIKKDVKRIEKIENQIYSNLFQTEKKSRLKIRNLKTHEAELKLFSQNCDLKKEKENLQKFIENKYIDVISLRSKKRKIFDNIFQAIPVKKLPWKFFPKGEWTAEEIIKVFGRYVRHNEVIDERRLRKIIDNLKPSFCYVSEDGFNRYIAFCFDGKDKVIMECPIYGNATYIIRGDWQEITKLPKWEAKQLKQVTIIKHTGIWFSRLKSKLDSRF